MKAWVLYGPNDFRYENIDKPILKEGEVLVKVRACGICGSDIPRVFFTGAHKHPLIPGHEFSGEVVETFDKNSAWLNKRVGVFPLIPCGECDPCRRGFVELCRNYNYLGSRCNGGFAEYVEVPESNLIEIPDGVSYEEAAMLEPMAVAAHAMRRVGINDEDKVLVVGLGTIGLLLSMILKASGAENLSVVGNKAIQKNQIISMGIDEKRYFDFESAPGADVIYECVGKNETIARAFNLANPAGKIITVGNPAGDMSFDKSTYWKILRGQLSVNGTWNSSFTHSSNDDWNFILRMLQRKSINPGQLITHRYSIDEVINGFEIMRDKTEPYIKVMMVV